MTKTEGALWSLGGGLIGAEMETFGDGSRDYLGRLVRLEREILLMYGVPSMEVLGAIAGFCTTFAFVPQIVKIHKQGGRDLSYGMLAFYLVGVLLWLGLRRDAAVTFGDPDKYGDIAADRGGDSDESVERKTGPSRAAGQ